MNGNGWTRDTMLGRTVGLVAALVCYAPVLVTQGASGMRFVDEAIPPGLRLRLIGYGVTVGTWGMLGLAGLAIAVLGAHRPGTPARRQTVIACAVAVGVYVAIFARLPLEFAYLIPIVPFTVLSRPVYVRAGFALVLLSGFVRSADAQERSAYLAAGQSIVYLTKDGVRYIGGLVFHRSPGGAPRVEEIAFAR